MTWTSDARSVNGWFCAAFGRLRARFEVTRMQSLDRARSQLSIKKRTTKKGGDGEEGAFLEWGYAHHLGYMTQGVIIHGHMA